MTDPDIIVIRPAFRDALAALQADYDARCETCAHHSTLFVAPGEVHCFQLDIDMPVDAVCPEWEART